MIIVKSFVFNIEIYRLSNYRNVKAAILHLLSKNGMLTSKPLLQSLKCNQYIEKSKALFAGLEYCIVKAAIEESF